ncbi:MAG: hypothetical protein KatS3mg057_0769 [Herpetosiphonaceae bacterium]|nr:MAG: hypothetical protein KatS3mg057_0769 [Herpetosiphonaceae bacterium]
MVDHTTIAGVVWRAPPLQLPSLIIVAVVVQEEDDSAMKPEELSYQLRHGSSAFLARRRAVLGLSLVAIGAMGTIALYQVGIIKHLPEPPLPYLNADAVDAAAEAYAYVATPDAVLGLASYGLTAVLAALGGADRADRQPWISLAMAAKIAIDALGAAKLTMDQWTRHRAFCSYCLLALPEVHAALRGLRRQQERREHAFAQNERS